MTTTVKHLPTKQILRHRRDQSAGEDERSDNRENDGLGKWPEEVAGDSAELKHRRKNNAEHEQRDKCRNDNLLGTIQNGRLDVLALLKMIENIFERHSSFVNQHADSKGKATKRHNVYGLTEPGKDGQRKQNGKRNGDDDDHRRAPAAKKKQNHQSDEGSSKDRLPKHTENGGLDENRLVAHGVHINAGRQGLLDPRQQPLDSTNDVESRHSAGLENRHQHGLGPIDTNHIGLRGGTFMHESDVTDVDHRAVDCLHRKAIDVVEYDRTGIERDIPIVGADFLVPSRQDEVLSRYGVKDVLGRYVVLLHRALVEIDLNLEDLPAVR